MKRRTFLGGGCAALGLGWAGCGGAGHPLEDSPDRAGRSGSAGGAQPRGNGAARRPAHVPVVDLHCHNFNGEDIPLAAFLSGKFHNVPDWFMRASGEVFAGLAHIAAPSAACERDLLAGRRACVGEEVASYPLEIARWLMGTTVGDFIDRAGIDPPGEKQLDLARRFLADIDAGPLRRADPAIERARRLRVVTGGVLTPAERLLQFLELVALGAIHEGRKRALQLGGLIVSGAKVLSREELRRLERSAQPRHVAEFEERYGGEIDRQIERDAPLAEDRALHEKIAGHLARWGTKLLDAATLQPLARSGKRLLALLWSYVRGYGAFAASFFRFRHQLSRDVATTYPRVELFTPLLVDFSYWTGSAEQPRSSLADQIATQRQLAIASLDSAASVRRGGDGGRFALRAAFLPFVAYNPLREVLRPSMPEHRPGRPLATLDGALDLVRAAILEHGFIGVKLYPPVGFAPLGNARHRRWTDGRLGKLDRTLAGDELRRWRQARKELGRHLDQALRALYRFCQEHEVPILAHSNDSNSFQPGYGWCSGPEHWLAALREFPGLRLCLGHFGHFTGVTADGDPAASRRVAGCFERISSYAWSYRASELFAHDHVYVDLSNSEAGTDAAAGRRLVALIRKLDARSEGALRQRLIYGSDWFMNLLNGPHERFLDNLESAFGQAWSGSETVAAVMGGNALRFLGLTPDADGDIPANLARVRRHHGARLPAWLRSG